MSHKYERVVAAAEAATPPWNHILSTEDGECTLTLNRGEEAMVLHWDGRGGLVHPLTYKLYGVRDAKLRNVAEAIRYIGERPNYKIRSSTRKAAAESTVDTVVRAALDESYFDMDDKGIIKLLRGKRITWHNEMLDQYETAEVPDRYRILVPDGAGGKKPVWRTSRNISMSTSSAGRRIITFPAVGEQFRSVALEKIVDVS